MSKVIVDLCFPQLDTSYHCILPVALSVQEVIDLIAEAMAELSDIRQNTEDLVLYLEDTGKILNETLLLSQTDIKDGSRLFIC